jgi:hypothetical protein
MPLARTLPFCLVAFSAAAAAGLGDHAAPAASADAIRKGTDTKAAYSERRRRLDSGTEVIEYVDTRGSVFAVSWSGPFLPDLRETLGTHFAVVAREQQNSQRLHAPVEIRTGELVVLSGGHMGAFAGRAWLPTRLPQGFDARTLP